MVYNQRLVVCVKANGKILREIGDTVYLPWGTEYSILIKNLNVVRAEVRVFIDGTDVLDGSHLVVDSTKGKNEVELERFVRNGNLKTGNRLKFIEMTECLEEARGARPEDGVVRVEYEFERHFTPPKIGPNWIMPTVGDPPPYNPWPTPTIFCADPNVMIGSTLRSVQATASTSGITVPGSKSDQELKAADYIWTDGELHSVVLQLKGEVAGKTVVKPIDVKARTKCETCGRVGKVTDKFCSACGTSLEIF